jgi:RNA polymerase sigma factor (sigma-70 family)
MPQPPQPSGEAPQGGHDEALRAWMIEYGPALRRYFLKRVPSPDAEDLVQDVFMAMQVRGALDDPGKAERYLFRVAANVLARRHRKRAWTGQHQSLDDDFGLADPLSPERILLDRESLGRLMRVLDDLPPRMNEAFILHRFEEMTYPEVARRMGLSPKTVENFIARAMKRIWLALEDAR